MEKYSLENGDVGEDYDLCCRIFEKAHQFGPDNLKKSALQCIIRKSPIILNTKSILILSTEALVEVLQDENLRVENEMQLFKMVMRMAHHNCANLKIEPSSSNLCKLVKKLLPLIRFPLMSPEDFFNFVQPTNILDPDQSEFMNKWFSTESKTNLNNNPKFSTHSRPPGRSKEDCTTNICERTVQFAKAIEKLEDFTPTSVFSGNVNVMQLQLILCNVQNYVTKLAGELRESHKLTVDLRTTQSALLEKTVQLEFHHGKDKMDWLAKDSERQSAILQLNCELQAVTKKISSTNTAVETTNRNLKDTIHDLKETKQDLQKTTEKLAETRTKLNKNRQILEQTREQLAETQLELKDAQFDLKKMHNDFQCSVKDFKNFRQDFNQLRDHFEETQTEVQRVKLEVQKNGKWIEKVGGDVDKMRVTLVNHQADLLMVKKAFVDINREVDLTSKKLEETKSAILKEAADLARIENYSWKLHKFDDKMALAVPLPLTTTNKPDKMVI